MTDTRARLGRGFSLLEFSIDSLLGSGGFANTYLAHDTRLDRAVAIKEYFPSDTAFRDADLAVRPISPAHRNAFEKGRRWFLKEARTVARLRHRNIVEVHRMFEMHNTVYMVLDLVDGQCLKHRLQSGLPNQRALDTLTRGLVDALALIHSRDLLHCDIADDNIMIRSADGSPVLIDFGGARQGVARESHSILGIVKACYSPPEQYGLEPDLQGPWSDIYALGAVLYKCVTGRVPPVAMRRMIEDNYVSAVHAARPGYRIEFLRAIDWALRLDRSTRPQSVEAFAGALFAFAPPVRHLPPPLSVPVLDSASRPAAQPLARAPRAQVVPQALQNGPMQQLISLSLAAGLGAAIMGSGMTLSGIATRDASTLATQPLKELIRQRSITTSNVTTTRMEPKGHFANLVIPEPQLISGPELAKRNRPAQPAK